jgi:hypothetical protein
MDKNDIDLALHEIESMIEFAIQAGESLNGVGDGKMFQMPAKDASLLSFAILNVQERLRALSANLH